MARVVPRCDILRVRDMRMNDGGSLDKITPIETFVLPIGRQRIDLQQIEFEAGGMAMLRVRIREGSRFTVFDVDRQSAAHWARAMLSWAEKGA
jgi:hypothetical protein